ncbi:MAG TPA: GNAT family N-acetyltransferase [Roseiflexaceae bacterium]|nr:GNAT family N-acetyltransferase [Roseiflexaceae bacterium]
MAMTQFTEIQAIPYNRANASLRYAIALLQHRVAPTAVPPPGDPIPPEHDPMLDALSFYLLADSRLVSYAAILHKQITHGHATFWIAGLSCVATDPEYQGQGLGSRVVGAATRYIEQNTIDFGIFTCDPPLAGFYWRAGAWAVVEDVVLIGGHDEGALTSVSLQKVVLMRLFSAKAQAAASQLRQTVIDLGLPPGQFW